MDVPSQPWRRRTGLWWGGEVVDEGLGCRREKAMPSALASSGGGMTTERWAVGRGYGWENKGQRWRGTEKLMGEYVGTARVVSGPDGASEVAVVKL